MSLKTIFKRLILLELLLILAITSSIFFESKEVMSFNESVPIADGIVIFLVVWLLALFASLYLLYNFKKIGKKLFLGVFILGLVLALISGPLATDSWTYVLDAIECSISGVLIFILYFTPIKKEFEK
tara:strand:- start:1230 stop:1610 length:381 start_codon:yes stop_codon:yes gene_type:complete